jgi:hypothetical protein
MSWTVVADESTQGRYLLAVTIIRNAHVAASRRAVTDLGRSLPHWRHMSQQSDPARSKIVSMIAGLEQRSVVYDAGGDRTSAGRQRQRQRRDSCLRALVADLAGLTGDIRLVLDSHASAQKSDEVTLYQARATHNLINRLRYEHVPEQQEPLILIADAVAWCFAKGAHWYDQLGDTAERRACP